MLRISCMVLLAIISLTNAVELFITNNEGGPIWVGILGYNQKPILEGGGFELRSRQTRVVHAPGNWAGGIWARTWCDPKTKHCLTGDCGNRLQCQGNRGAPPISLVEITLKGSRGLDYYDISLINGYNIGVAIEPINGRGDGSWYSCKKVGCFNLRQHCPPELRQKSRHGTLGCNSACTAFNTDQYCCRGAYSQPQTCRPQNWPKNYAAIFKQHCPNVFSYIYDDDKTTYTCTAQKYRIEFGGLN